MFWYQSALGLPAATNTSPDRASNRSTITQVRRILPDRRPRCVMSMNRRPSTQPSLSRYSGSDHLLTHHNQPRLTRPGRARAPGAVRRGVSRPCERTTTISSFPPFIRALTAERANGPRASSMVWMHARRRDQDPASQVVRLTSRACREQRRKGHAIEHFGYGAAATIPATQPRGAQCDEVVETTTLDRLSGGAAHLGVGIGSPPRWTSMASSISSR